MTEPRIYTAEEAEALRAGATPGPWRVGHSVEGRMDDDWNIYNDDGCDVTSPTGTGICAEDAAMLAAAPDLAASVAHHARRADEAERQRDHLAAMLVRRTRDAACWRFMTENGVPNDTEAAMAVWWRDSADRDALVQMLGAEAVERAEASRG